MRILHLSSEKTWRGGEQQIAYLIDELTINGIENFVACRSESVFEKHCQKNNIQHISIGFTNNFDLISAKQIKKYANRNSIDIIHMHSSRSHSIGVLARLLGSKVKLILSRRVDFSSSGNWLSNFKYNHTSIERIICVSHKIKEVISQTVKDKSKLKVVHDGIDLHKFTDHKKSDKLHSEYGLSVSTKIIANISAIVGHKDYFTFVDTAKNVLQQTNEPIKFFIIGEGKLRLEIENHIAELGLTKEVILTGFRTDIPEIIKEIDIFLMTSEEEGLGTTVLDAFANNIPVVATAGGGIPEMVKNEQTGLLSPIKSPKDLAKNVLRLLSDKQLQNQLTTEAYALLEAQFTKQKMALDTLAIYKEVLEKKKNL